MTDAAQSLSRARGLRQRRACFKLQTGCLPVCCEVGPRHHDALLGGRPARGYAPVLVGPGCSLLVKTVSGPRPASEAAPGYPCRRSVASNSP
eukprot:3011905-Rhodomonas_salina.1